MRVGIGLLSRFKRLEIALQDHYQDPSLPCASQTLNCKVYRHGPGPVCTTYLITYLQISASLSGTPSLALRSIVGYCYNHLNSTIPIRLPSCCENFITTAAVTILPLDATHSADYAVARCPSVCLSVRPSVTRRYNVETDKHIKHFSASGSHTILVFFIPNVLTLFLRRPLMGTSNAGA